MKTVFKHIYVSGRVQGVFFRESTRQQAVELGLTGGVRNLRDGRVEVLVAGEEAEVQTLIKWLKIGPKFAKVTTIKVSDLTAAAFQHQQTGVFDVWATK